MLKTKLLAISCLVGILSISPISVMASETDSVSVTLSEKNQKDDKSAFDDEMKKAKEKWDSLTEKQKKEVYTLLEKEMKSEIKLMEKLVELGIISKEDAGNIKVRMQEKLDEIKESGGFPLARPKHEKKQK